VWERATQLRLFNQREVTQYVDQSGTSSQPWAVSDTSPSRQLATSSRPRRSKVQIVSTPLVLEHPSGVRPRRVRTGGRDLAALEARPAEGVPLRGVGVLLPGFTGSKEDFTAILAPLAARGWWTVALDQRGQFESPGPDRVAAYGLAEYGADALEIINGLIVEIAEESASIDTPDDSDLDVHLVGHSLGGLVARETALRVWTDSSAAVLTSLTMLCSGPGALPEEAHAGLAELHAALPQTDLQLIWTIVRTRAGESLSGDPITDFLRKRFLANNPWALKSMSVILRESPDRTEELARLVTADPGSRRVLVAYGEGDDAWPTDVQDEMARRLGSAAVVLPGAGHSPAAESHRSAASTVELLHRFWSAGGDSDRDSDRDSHGESDGESTQRADSV